VYAPAQLHRNFFIPWHKVNIAECLHAAWVKECPALSCDTYAFCIQADATVSACPTCALMFNDQSLEMLLYRQHGIVRERRTVIIVPVKDMNEVSSSQRCTVGGLHHLCSPLHTTQRVLMWLFCCAAFRGGVCCRFVVVEEPVSEVVGT